MSHEACASAAPRWSPLVAFALDDRRPRAQSNETNRAKMAGAEKMSFNCKFA